MLQKKKKRKKERKETEKRGGEKRKGKGREGKGKKEKNELPLIPVIGQIILLKSLILNTMYLSIAIVTVPTSHLFT